jgi:FkbM family methyltransferase
VFEKTFEKKIKYRTGTNDLDILERVNKEYFILLNHMNANEIVLDIGAHIGGFAYQAWKRGAKEIVCIEPDSDNFSLLTKNAKLLSNVSCINGAVTGQAPLIKLGKGKLRKATGNNKTVGCLRNDGTETVEVWSLEVLLEKYKPSVLKIDIETEELQIDFSNIHKCVKTLAIEYHPGFKGQRIHDQLTKQGFIVISSPELKIAINTVGIYERKTIVLKEKK